MGRWRLAPWSCSPSGEELPARRASAPVSAPPRPRRMGTNRGAQISFKKRSIRLSAPVAPVEMDHMSKSELYTLV